MNIRYSKIFNGMLNLSENYECTKMVVEKFDCLKKLIANRMKKNLYLKDNDKEIIIKNFVFECLGFYEISNDLNCNFTKYRLPYGIHKFEYGNYALCKYENDRLKKIHNFNNFHILYDGKNYDFISDWFEIPISTVKEIYIDIVYDYYYNKIEFLQKLILWDWINDLNDKKNANIIYKSNIIEGNYKDLVDMYNYLLDL